MFMIIFGLGTAHWNYWDNVIFIYHFGYMITGLTSMMPRKATNELLHVWVIWHKFNFVNQIAQVHCYTRKPTCPSHGPFSRYEKLWVAHAPAMPGTFSPPPRVGDPDMHHGVYVTHVPWCVPRSPSNSFLWVSVGENISRYSRRMPSPQFYVSGKRPMRRIHN